MVTTMYLPGDPWGGWKCKMTRREWVHGEHLARMLKS